jgi:hypothetical protein
MLSPLAFQRESDPVSFSEPPLFCFSSAKPTSRYQSVSLDERNGDFAFSDAFPATSAHR